MQQRGLAATLSEVRRGSSVRNSPVAVDNLFTMFVVLKRVV